MSINNREFLKKDGPLIVAANHPNSFLDAVLMITLFKHPVYSLARGDAFVSNLVKRIFRSLKMLPVYRISEGRENLKRNYDTFDEVQKLLSNNKIVLIFSEGLCINEWRLRPLKKGTARMAFRAWEKKIPLQILPVGINYSSFRHFGKNIDVNFGNIISASNFSSPYTGQDILNFDKLLQEELTRLVYEIPDGSTELRERIFRDGPDSRKKHWLIIAAIAGYLLNGPFYLGAHLIIRKIAKGHYDSLMVGIMFLFYPWFVFCASLAFYVITGRAVALSLLFLMPLTALAVLHYRGTVA